MRGERSSRGELGQEPGRGAGRRPSAAARRSASALEAFARNTVEHMVEERELLAGQARAAALRHRLPRPAGADRRARRRPPARTCSALRPYIRDVRPALVGVDGGANAILEEGFKPDMIVGDMDSASEATLRCGAELVVHAYADGRAPGREQLEALGLPHKVVPAPGTSQDIAMLIAAREGRRADRLRRLAVQPRRVPRQEPARDVLDVPHAPAARREARGRQGREPPVPPAPGAAPVAARARRSASSRSSPSCRDARAA